MNKKKKIKCLCFNLTSFHHLLGTEVPKRNRGKQRIGWRRGDLQPAGAFSGKAGLDQQGKTAQIAPSPETSTGMLTGGGRGRSGNPGERRQKSP